MNHPLLNLNFLRPGSDFRLIILSREFTLFSPPSRES